MWHKKQSTDLNECGIRTHIQRWNIAVERNGEYFEK